MQVQCIGRFFNGLAVFPDRVVRASLDFKDFCRKLVDAIGSRGGVEHRGNGLVPAFEVKPGSFVENIGVLGVLGLECSEQIQGAIKLLSCNTAACCSQAGQLGRQWICC